MTLQTENYLSADTVIPPHPIGPPFADHATQEAAVNMPIAVCSYLGLFDDRGLVLSEPTDAHRCYARTRPIIPSDAHQNSHCLRGTHIHCRFYHPMGLPALAPQVSLPTLPTSQTPPAYQPAQYEEQTVVDQSYAPYQLDERQTATPSPYHNGPTNAPYALQTGPFTAPSGPYGLASSPYAITTPPSTASGRGWTPQRNWLMLASGVFGAILLLSIGLWIGQQWGQPAAVATPIATPVLPTLPSLAQLPTAEQPVAAQPAPVAQATNIQPASIQPGSDNQAVPTSQPTNPPLVPAVLLQTETATPAAIVTPLPANAGELASTASNVVLGADPFELITPEPNGDVLRLIPRTGSVGWWKTNDQEPNHLNDSFLYAGVENGDVYLSAIRFDLTRIARGAPLQRVALRLTGLRADRLSPTSNGAWNVEALGDTLPIVLGRATYDELRTATAIWSLPQLKQSDLAEGKEFLWELDEATRYWLEQQVINGVRTLTLRITANIENSSAANDTIDSLFAWDSGLGPETQRKWPTLLVVAGAPPATPPPLPSQTVIVATLTPTPENVLTVVAQGATATYVAQTVGTYTPLPYALVTPTLLPKNLATLQVLANQQGLPPVALDTPVPQNEATATAIAGFATAVAQTTGTFTPVPANYVTPALIIGSPPAENVATEAARSATATIEATYGYPTPTALPHNAIFAEYVYATELPENAATAAAVSTLATAQALVEGTPTPLPWNAIVITRVPTPLSARSAAQSTRRQPQPTATPVPANATATVTERTTSAPLVVNSGDLRNKILFRRAGANGDETWFFDPITGSAGQIAETTLYEQTKQLLGYSPDLSQLVYVSTDASGNYQIFARRADGATQQLTRFKGASYDPVWSPRGNLIAFVSNEAGNDEIYVMDPNGENVQRLTDSERFDKHPTWSPDGQFLVFYSTREGHRQLWIMRPDGSGQRNLSNNQSEDFDPVWVR